MEATFYAPAENSQPMEINFGGKRVKQKQKIKSRDLAQVATRAGASYDWFIWTDVDVA